MRAFSSQPNDGPAGAGDDEEAPRRVISLKKGRDGSGAAEQASPRKRTREDASANGDEDGESRKKGVRGRGAATYQSSVVAAMDDGPRRDPPAADPSRVLKIEGLKRPFQDKQLRDALQGADGKGRRDITWFWLNRIKSVCFVEFEHEREADAARTELYDLTWPSTSFSPGRLNISFTTREAANRTVAEEPVGLTRDPVSARLGHIPGVGGLPGVGGSGGMRGWGSLSDASTAVRGGGGGRNSNMAANMASRLGGPIGGVTGFGVTGGGEPMRGPRGGAGYDGGGPGGGRGWGSLAAGTPRGGGFGGGGGMNAQAGDRGDDRGRDASSRGAPGQYRSPRDAPVRLEDLFNKTKTKPEIYWTRNPAAVRERRLAQIRGSVQEARGGGPGLVPARGGR